MIVIILLAIVALIWFGYITHGWVSDAIKRNRTIKLKEVEQVFTYAFSGMYDSVAYNRKLDLPRSAPRSKEVKKALKQTEFSVVVENEVASIRYQIKDIFGTSREVIHSSLNRNNRDIILQVFDDVVGYVANEAVRKDELPIVMISAKISDHPLLKK